MVTKSTVKTPANNELSELEILKKQVETLTKQLNSMENRTSQGQPKEVESFEKIDADEYISVMSLLPYTLNLSTKAGGQGNIKKFTKLYEVKKILYRDLVDIIETHPNFLESGYFYILHPGFIRQHGLDEIYSKILTKEMIEEIVSTEKEESVNLYNSANDEQKEVIIQLLIDKVRDYPDSVNLNIIDRISRVAGIDIAKRAEESKSLSEIAEE